MPKKQKLELTWIGKDQRPKLEPRILIEDPEKSYHAPQRVSENDIFDNMLIHGDNLLALKALEQEYTGKVKCVFIDPPYNTGQAFEHYDNGIEVSLWLTLMRARLSILKRLLKSDGVIFVQIDDNNFANLRLLLDETFGAQNYINTILGPSLIEQDKWGNPIISKEFDPPKLTQAMCKLEGFDYAPDPDTYWMQGRSSETDFIYVTSQTMSKDMLAKLSYEVGDNRSLLVCCPSFRAKEGDFPNLTLKKIPKAVLKKCEWGRDDYSLQIQELPPAPPPEDEEAETKPKKARRKFGKDNPNQGELF
jgi:hypothetical protein